MRRLPLLFLLVSPLLFVPGCSDPTKGDISGMVKVDGEPAKEGSITLVPIDGKSTVEGGVIKDGQYVAEGVPIGTKKVEIRVTTIVGQTKIYNTPDSPIQDIRAQILPPKYNTQTELTMEVSPGQNQQDFELTTK